SQRSTWLLGFRRASAVAATLDGDKAAALQWSPDGFSLVVDTPGRHTLAMDLELPLQSRSAKGGERGVVLNLPGSPITVIEQFELPAGVESVRVGPQVATAPLAVSPAVRTLAAKDLLKPKGEWPALAL